MEVECRTVVVPMFVYRAILEALLPEERFLMGNGALVLFTFNADGNLLKRLEFEVAQ